MLFWRSAYLVRLTLLSFSEVQFADAQSTLYSVRNRTLVLTDWMKVKIFGRYVSLSKNPSLL